MSGEKLSKDDILKKHNLLVDLVHNPTMCERVYKAMEEYANQPKEEVRLGLVKDFHDKMRGAKSTETQQDNGLKEAAEMILNHNYDTSNDWELPPEMRDELEKALRG